MNLVILKGRLAKDPETPAPAKAGTAAGGFGQPVPDEEIPF